MSNKLFDSLKWIALTLPLVITFVAAIMKIWNVPYAVEIGLSLNALNAFIAELVKVANGNYYKKQEQLRQDEMEDENIEIDEEKEEN